VVDFYFLVSKILSVQLSMVSMHKYIFEMRTNTVLNSFDDLIHAKQFLFLQCKGEHCRTAIYFARRKIKGVCNCLFIFHIIYTTHVFSIGDPS
jgi:hypothetical protein